MSKVICFLDFHTYSMSVDFSSLFLVPADGEYIIRRLMNDLRF